MTSSDRVTVPVGSKFHVISPVAEITDDKDKSEELFLNIQVSGEYDLNTPGEYRLEYIVTDSDGNDSVAQSLTLLVEG